jgi:hypothetical protein
MPVYKYYVRGCSCSGCRFSTGHIILLMLDVLFNFDALCNLDVLFKLDVLRAELFKYIL